MPIIKREVLVERLTTIIAGIGVVAIGSIIWLGFVLIKHMVSELLSFRYGGFMLTIILTMFGLISFLAFRMIVPSLDTYVW
jgi:hypothetical protein